MGLIEPLALLALPLALIPLLLEWQGRRSGEPVRFSSLYLLERARRTTRRWTPTRSRWITLLRSAIIAALVLAAARPVGPGAGGPATHYPTSLVVVVDVSSSTRQNHEGVSAWSGIQAAADSLLALAGPEDELALAAVADGIVGWWEASAPALRRRLGDLEPTWRASDWPATLAALESRIDKGTESYLFTDGSQGGTPPEVDRGISDNDLGHRVVHLWGAPARDNRGLSEARWVAGGLVALRARGWGSSPAAVATAGRLVGTDIVEPAPLLLDPAGSQTAVWSLPDTATFAFVEADRFSGDDRRYVAPGRGGIYHVARWAPADEPPDSGPLFWELALAAAPRQPVVQRGADLGSLLDLEAQTIILPLRTYQAGEARALAGLAREGARLLFVAVCPRVCAPPSGWFPADLDLPDVRPGPASGTAGTILAERPSGTDVEAIVPGHLVSRVPVREAYSVTADPAAEWTWALSSGEPALWVRDNVAIWLVPFGPPATRLGTTPLFPLMADAVMSAWDASWSAGRAGVEVGEPFPADPTGGTIEGPLHLGADRSTWSIPPSGRPPRPQHPGIYRLSPIGAEGASFVAVNSDSREGDLTPISSDVWEQAWGAQPIDEGAWHGALFPRRKGPELWSWFVLLAVAGLVIESRLRRSEADN